MCLDDSLDPRCYEDWAITCCTGIEVGVPSFRKGKTRPANFINANRHQMKIHHFLHRMMRGKGMAALMHFRKLRDHGSLNGGHLLDVLADSQPSHHHRRGAGQELNQFDPNSVTNSLRVKGLGSSQF